MDTVLLYTDRFLSVVPLISYIPKERIVSGPESSPGSYIELCCHFSLVSFNLNSSSFFLCLCGLGIFEEHVQASRSVEYPSTAAVHGSSWLDSGCAFWAGILSGASQSVACIGASGDWPPLLG